jgi:DNA-binding protein HU-beta
MTKRDLVKVIAETTGFTQQDVLTVVDNVFETIASTVKNDEVSITGFGKFVTTARAERMMRNPATGEQVKVAAKKAIKFKPAKSLKDSINS